LRTRARTYKGLQVSNDSPHSVIAVNDLVDENFVRHDQPGEHVMWLRESPRNLGTSDCLPVDLLKTWEPHETLRKIKVPDVFENPRTVTPLENQTPKHPWLRRRPPCARTLVQRACHRCAYLSIRPMKHSRTYLSGYLNTTITVGDAILKIDDRDAQFVDLPTLHGMLR